jgi:hypothetical protein
MISSSGCSSMATSRIADFLCRSLEARPVLDHRCLHIEGLFGCRLDGGVYNSNMFYAESQRGPSLQLKCPIMAIYPSDIVWLSKARSNT